MHARIHYIDGKYLLEITTGFFSDPLSTSLCFILKHRDPSLSGIAGRITVQAQPKSSSSSSNISSATVTLLKHQAKRFWMWKRRGRSEQNSPTNPNSAHIEILTTKSQVVPKQS